MYRHKEFRRATRQENPAKVFRTARCNSSSPSSQTMKPSAATGCSFRKTPRSSVEAMSPAKRTGSGIASAPAASVATMTIGGLEEPAVLLKQCAGGGARNHHVTKPFPLEWLGHAYNRTERICVTSRISRRTGCLAHEGITE